MEATIILHPILGFLWHTNIWLVSSPTIQALVQSVDSLQFQCLEYTFSPGDLLKVVAFWLICWDFSVDTKLCLFLKPITLLCRPRANIIHSKILVQASLYFRGFYSYFLWLTGSNVQMEIEFMIVCNFAYSVITAISVNKMIFAAQQDLYIEFVIRALIHNVFCGSQGPLLIQDLTVTSTPLCKRKYLAITLVALSGALLTPTLILYLRFSPDFFHVALDMIAQLDNSATALLALDHFPIKNPTCHAGTVCKYSSLQLENGFVPTIFKWIYKATGAHCFFISLFRFIVSRYERTGSDGLFQSKLFAHSMISVGRSQQFRDIYFYHSILLHTPSMYLVFTFLDHNQVSPHQNTCISASSWDCSVVSTALFVNGSIIKFWTQDIIHGIAYTSIYGGTFLITSSSLSALSTILSFDITNWVDVHELFSYDRLFTIFSELALRQNVLELDLYLQGHRQYYKTRQYCKTKSMLQCRHNLVLPTLGIYFISRSYILLPVGAAVQLLDSLKLFDHGNISVAVHYTPCLVLTILGLLWYILHSESMGRQIILANILVLAHAIIDSTSKSEWWFPFIDTWDILLLFF